MKIDEHPPTSQEAASYRYANGDHYQGQFRGDLKSGEGLLTVEHAFTYQGEFKDDRKTGKCSLLEFTGGTKYSGGISKEEDLEGQGRLETAQVVYEGGFKESMFHGQGSITHKDTGNVYEGGFFKHHKDGKCTFTLKETGQVYKGYFDSNYESGTADMIDYGKRL